MQTTNVAGYQAIRDSGSDHLLIDVREPAEWDTCHLDNAKHIPMRTIPQHLEELAEWKNKPVYVMCHHGGRSGQVGMYLSQQGFTDVININGGIHAWATEIEPGMATY